ncbi:site-specific integrase [Sporosarcina psychrophila]|uniref:Integrase n=1 Tax=Sporosarcina psychrophila TaxID=1476 RepID=A0ABV2KAL1_SPOPS
MAVYKDKERGTWYFVTRVKQLDGKMKQVKRRGFKTKKEAQIAEAETLTTVATVDSLTLGVIANEYLEWYTARRKESSANKLKSILSLHIVPKFGKMKIESIRASHVMEYQTELIKKYSPNHVKKIHAMLSSVFNFAIRMDYVKENPARVAGVSGMDAPKHIDYWILDEFKSFISHVDDLFYRTLFMTLYYSGLRRGEILALTWADIDFDTNTINVDKSVLHKKVTTPKTDASTRKLMMPSHVMRLLLLLKRDAAPMNLSHVVFGEIHDNISNTTLARNYEKYIKLSGVKRIRLHDFRHSHASYLINKGYLISIVSKRLGHSNPSTTLNVYSHLYPSTEAEAIESMEKDFETAKILKMLP